MKAIAAALPILAALLAPIAANTNAKRPPHPNPLPKGEGLKFRREGPSPSAASVRAPGDLALAWLRDGRVETRGAARAGVGATAGAGASVIRTPLGSVWKLFVHAYAVERGVETPPYRCGATPGRDEEYCCEPGGSIDRDRALARSCGRFFEPRRLGIDAAAWKSFWKPRVGTQAAWLADLNNLRPETTMPVSDLLHALAALPPGARGAAERALLPVMIDGYGRGNAAHVGGLLRIKTFTWDDPDRPGASMGGAAGWLVDGTPVWFAAAGSSRRVLTDHAATLTAWLPTPQRGPVDEPCVVVQFFERYPIRAIDRLAPNAPHAPHAPRASRESARPGEAASTPKGPLHGRFRVTFENGNVLTFASAGELVLDGDGSRDGNRDGSRDGYRDRNGDGDSDSDGNSDGDGDGDGRGARDDAGSRSRSNPRSRQRLRIIGQFPMSEYIARVIDREADATVAEAARALAIVARSWTIENAPFERGCFRVADSSRMQRVSPNAPTDAAKAAALFTDGLVLHGSSVRYHRDTAAPGVMSWRAAVAQARDGRAFDLILADAFPRTSLAAVSGERECRRLQDADAWLARMMPTWRRRLAAQAGFEAPERLSVCGLEYGNPYADRARQRIYVRGIATREDRIAVAHEYIHLAFRFHPRGNEESFVESLARTLVDEPMRMETRSGSNQ
jgi:uncharacterized protein YfaQ (DUF2300 family)